MKKIIQKINRFEEVFCVIFLAIALIVLTYQVITRYFFHAPSKWSEEVARYFYIAFVYLGMSYAERDNAHIRIEMMHKVFPKAMRKGVLLIGEIVFLAFAVVMAYFCMKYTIDDVILGNRTSLTLLINLGWVYIFTGLGYILLAVRIVVNIITKGYLPKTMEEVTEETLKAEGGGNDE